MLPTQYGEILHHLRGFERNDASVSYRTVRLMMASIIIFL